MRFEDIQIKSLENNIVSFNYKDEITVRCINYSNDLLIYNVDLKIDLDILKILFDKLKTKKTIENYSFFEKHEFLNLILWIVPEKYKLYKKLIFYIKMSYFLDKIKTSNEKLQNLKKNII